jgi:hypothetical protein
MQAMEGKLTSAEKFAPNPEGNPLDRGRTAGRGPLNRAGFRAIKHGGCVAKSLILLSLGLKFVSRAETESSVAALGFGSEGSSHPSLPKIDAQIEDTSENHHIEFP